MLLAPPPSCGDVDAGQLLHDLVRSLTAKARWHNWPMSSFRGGREPGVLSYSAHAVAGTVRCMPASMDCQ